MPVRLTPAFHARPALLAAACCAAAVALLGGCGGSGAGEGPAAAGSVAVTVNWPVPERVGSAAIPAAAQSVGVELSTKAGWSAQAAVARPAAGGPATLTVDGVPAGFVHLHFGAYSGPPVAAAPRSIAPSGDLLAWAVDDVTVVAGEAAEVQFSLSGLPDHVVLSTGGASTALRVGEDLQVYATAYDADDNVLAVTGWDWTSSAPRTAGVDSAGLVHAASPGSATITASHGGVEGHLGVTVLSPPYVTLTADDPAIRLGMGTTLRWTATNATSVTASNFGAASVSGSLEVYPTATTTYTITVTGPGGEATAETTVTVGVAPAVAAGRGGM